MDEELNKSLKKNLDELIRLFKKIKDKSVFDDLPGTDKLFIQNFDLLLQNYDEIKGDLSEQLLSQFGSPIHKMIEDIVKQLKEQLGEDDLLNELQKEDKEKKEPQKVLITPEPSNTQEEIDSIDRQLKSNRLSEAEIDGLLDRRSDLSKRLQ